MKAFDRDRTLSLKELAAIALITSDNPVAVLLEERVGREAVGEVLMRAGITVGDATMQAGFQEVELGAKNRANVMRALDVLKLFQHLHSERRYGSINRDSVLTGHVAYFTRRALLELLVDKGFRIVEDRQVGQRSGWLKLQEAEGRRVAPLARLAWWLSDSEATAQSDVAGR